MGITRQGALYYSVRTGVSDVYLAKIDPETGSVLSPPSPLTARFVGWNRSPDWSADGQFVAYVSQRDSLLRSPGWTGGTIVVRSLATGEEREITPRLASMGSLRWSPDGRFFLVSGRDDRGRRGFFTLRAETGEATLVLNEEAPAQVQFPAWSPDGRSFYLLPHDARGPQPPPRSGTGHGRDREVFSKSTNNMALSPDGRSMVVRLANRGIERVCLPWCRSAVAKRGSWCGSSRAFPPGGGLAWTPDGKHMLFTQTKDDSEQPFELWRIPLEGGAPLQTGIAMEGLRDLRVHPDGQQIAFRAGHGQGEVWVMAEFLPGTDR